MKQKLFSITLALVTALVITMPAVTASDSVQEKPRKHFGILENFATGQHQMVESIQGEAEPSVGIQAVIGQKRLAVLLVNFTDNTSRPLTREQAQQALLSSDPDSLSSRLSLHSYGRVTLTGDVFDWVTIAPPADQNGNPYTGCNKGLLAAKAAKVATGTDGMYDFYMLIVPRIDNCEFTGYANIFGPNSVLFASLSQRLAEHEIGHNFGLSHSRYNDFPASGRISIEGCPTYDPKNTFPCEYGDLGEAMGSGNDGYHAYNRFKLGWIDQSDTTGLTSATPDVTLNLAPCESSRGLRDIAAPLDDGSGYSYHVQYSSDRLLPGLTIRLNQPNQKNASGMDTGSFYSYLIPAGSDHSSPRMAALPPGHTFTDTTNGIKVTLLSQDSSGAKARIQLSPVIKSVSSPEGSKKVTVRGVHFGSDARLFVDDKDVTDEVNWPIREDVVLKAKGGAIRQALGSSGNHKVQVVTASGAVSNAYIFTL